MTIPQLTIPQLKRKLKMMKDKWHPISIQYALQIRAIFNTLNELQETINTWDKVDYDGIYYYVAGNKMTKTAYYKSPLYKEKKRILKQYGKISWIQMLIDPKTMTFISY